MLTDVLAILLHAFLYQLTYLARTLDIFKYT